MRKTVLAIVLVAILAAGAAFADNHPDGWGIGLQGGYSGNWGAGGLGGVALSLKIPGIPVFWGISGAIYNKNFRLGLTGDYYIFDDILVPSVKLGWYLGVGGYLGFYSWSEGYYGKTYNATSFGLGVRAPIGLSWQPIDLFELYGGIALNLGILIQDEARYKDNHGVEHVWRDGGVVFPAGGWDLNLGFRIWL